MPTQDNPHTGFWVECIRVADQNKKKGPAFASQLDKKIGFARNWHKFQPKCGEIFFVQLDSKAEAFYRTNTYWVGQITVQRDV